MSDQHDEPAREPQQGEIPWWCNDPWLGGPGLMNERCNNPHLLDGYDWKYVALYPDGSGVRDSDEDPVALMERIKASGDLLEWYAFEYVIPPGSQI